MDIRTACFSAVLLQHAAFLMTGSRDRLLVWYTVPLVLDFDHSRCVIKSYGHLDTALTRHAAHLEANAVYRLNPSILTASEEGKDRYRAFVEWTYMVRGVSSPRTAYADYFASWQGLRPMIEMVAFREPQPRNYDVDESIFA